MIFWRALLVAFAVVTTLVFTAIFTAAILGRVFTILSFLTVFHKFSPSNRKGKTLFAHAFKR